MSDNINKFNLINIELPNGEILQCIPVIEAENILIDGIPIKDYVFTSNVPANHADSTTKFGVASDTQYGHVKININNSGLEVNNGILNTKLASETESGIISSKLYADFKLGVDRLNELRAMGIEGLIPINHAHETAKYGIASDTQYGHIKIDKNNNVGLDINNGELSLKEASNENGGALTPELYGKLENASEILEQLKASFEIEEGTFLLKEHSSTENTYGLASDTLYGHIKIKEENGIKINEGELSIDCATETSNGSMDSETYNKLLEVYDYYQSLETNQTEFQQVVPINHASAEPVYGVATYTNYGHIKINNDETVIQIDNGELSLPEANETQSGYITNDMYRKLEKSYGFLDGLFDEQTELTQEEMNEMVTNIVNIVRNKENAI